MPFFRKKSEPRNVKSTKLYRLDGYEILFQISPSPSPLAHIMTISTYISNIGLLQRAITCIGMDEKSFRRFPFRETAKQFLSFAKTVSRVKAVEYDSLKANLGQAGFTAPASLDSAVNKIIMKTCLDRGFMVQPIGGFDTMDMVNFMMSNPAHSGQSEALSKLRQNDAQPNKTQASPEADKKETQPVKKTTLH